MEAYKIGVSLMMQSNTPAFLQALSSKLLGVHADVQRLEGGLNRLNRMKLAIGGGLSIVGGAATLSAMTKVIDKGAEFIAMQSRMKLGGLNEAEIAQSTAKAWELTARYRSLGVTRIGDMINEVRAVYNSVPDAVANIEPALKAATVLQSTMKGKGQEQIVGQVFAMYKSADLRNLTDSPQATNAFFDNMTKVVTATGGKVTPNDFLQMVKYSKSAGQTWNDDFITRVAASMMQEGSPSTVGTALASMDQSVIGGKTTMQSNDMYRRLGLIKPNAAVFGNSGNVKDIQAGGIVGGDLFRQNPYDWVQKVLKPRIIDMLTKQNGGKPLSEDQIMKGAIPIMSGLYGNRNAEWIANTMFKERPIERDRALIDQAQGLEGADLLLREDWLTAVKGFTTQWDNLMTALGAPQVGSATKGLNYLSTEIAKVAQWAGLKENASTIRALGIGIAALGAGLIGAGAAALLAALGPAGWLVGGITAAITAWAGLDPSGFKATIMVLKGTADALAAAVKSFFADPAVFEPLKAFYQNAKDTAVALTATVKGFVTDPAFLVPLRAFFDATMKEINGIVAQVKAMAADPQSAETVRGTLTRTLEEAKWVVGWYQQVRDLVAGLGLGDMAKDAAGGAKGASPDLGGDLIGRFTTSIINGIRELAGKLVPLAAEWESAKAKFYGGVGDFVAQLGTQASNLVAEIQSWPARVGSAITGMGASIVNAIKAALGFGPKAPEAPGSAPAPEVPPSLEIAPSPMNYGGGRLEPSLIHRAAVEVGSVGRASQVAAPEVSGVARAMQITGPAADGATAALMRLKTALDAIAGMAGFGGGGGPNGGFDGAAAQAASYGGDSVQAGASVASGRAGSVAGPGRSGGSGGSGAIRGPISDGPTSGLRAEVRQYLRDAASAQGIDPNVAERVMKQESGFNPYAKNINSRESSYGVFQLNTKGGLGNVAQRQGINPADPTQWKRHIDFSLGVVKKDGWRQWYGARDVGISRWQGIGQAVPHMSPKRSAPEVIAPPVNRARPAEETPPPRPSVPPYRPQQAVTVQANLNVDGRKMATNTTRHQFDAANRPTRGSNFSDGSLMYPSAA